MPFFVELAVFGLAFLILYLFFSGGSSHGGRHARRRVEQKAAAQEALDEFTARRVKEERPNIEKALQAAQKIKADIEKATKELKR